jgi:hypothetical protein
MIILTHLYLSHGIGLGQAISNIKMSLRARSTSQHTKPSQSNRTEETPIVLLQSGTVVAHQKKV